MLTQEKNEKSAQRDANTARRLCKAEPKISPHHHRPPSRWRETVVCGGFRCEWVEIKSDKQFR